MASVDAVLVFAGSMQSEDTEKLDRRSASINPNHDMVIDMTSDYNKNMIVVLQTGSAVVLDGWHKKVPAIAEMWLAGEGADKAIAEVLCGKVNPSGKLPETFPTKLRTDMDYPGDGFKVEYNEKLDVGYRYYDKHPEEILYPFGHGLSYTSFEYSDIKVSQYNDGCKVSFKLKNTGEYDGSEVAQLYISDVVSTVVKPVKELKKFKKVFLKKGEETEVVFDLEKADFEYYNTSLHQWVAENGLYKILIGASSRDIRLEGNVVVDGDMPYTIAKVSEDMIG
jgi:beta-glucosidase